MSDLNIAAILTVPFLSAVLTGCILLKRAFSLPKALPEEFGLAFAWVFVVGSLVWLAVYLSGSSLLGFEAPWTWLASAHFMFAGFGALTMTALSCRVVSDLQKLRILRCLLFVHPVAYLVTAAGISGFPYCEEFGALVYFLLFSIQVWAVIFGRPDRIARSPRTLLTLALAVPVVTLVPAVAWAFRRPIFELVEMIHYHGIVNAVGHVGLGLTAFAWGRPQSQEAGL